MTSRWLTFLLLLAPALADDFQDSNPYYPDDIGGCISETMGICYVKPEDMVMPCICGQDSTDTEKIFLHKFAQCVGRELPNDIDQSYAGLTYDCAEYSLRLNFTRQEFGEVARESSENHADHATGLSTGATAGIAVGAVVGGVAIIGALVWIWLQRRKKSGAKLESNPSSPSNQEISPNWGAEFKPEWTANAPVELPPATAVPVYEMDATPMGPIEMPTPIPEDDGNKKEKAGRIIEKT